MSRGEEMAERIRVGHEELFGVYESFVADFLVRRGWPELPPEIDLADVEARNAAIYAYLRDQPLKRIVADEAAAYEKLVQAVTALDDADLDDPRRLGLPEGPEWRPEPFIAGNSYDHYPEHVEDVRRWVRELRR